MRYGSLCSGIGGLDLAVEAVFGASPTWFCEADPHARTVLERHWPGVPIWPDLKTQDWSSVEPVELVCAGYPCQPFSFAGRREGAEDPRHLWPYVIAAVRLLGPRYVVLENVAGHLGLGFDAVLGDLAEAGFDAEWTTLRASDIGACHGRLRLFVVAYPSGGADRAEAGRDQAGRADAPGPSGGPGGPDSGSTAYAGSGSLQRLGEPGVVAGSSRPAESEAQQRARGRDTARGCDQTAPDSGRGERSGRAPQPRRGAVERVAITRTGQDLPPDADRGRLEISPELDRQAQPDPPQRGSRRGHVDGRREPPSDAETVGCRPGRGPGEVQGPEVARRPAVESGRCGDALPAWGPYEPAIRRWEAVLGRDAPAPNERGRLAVPFVEWMMGFEPEWVAGLSRSAALRCLGNAVVPQQGAAALSILVGGEGVNDQ